VLLVIIALLSVVGVLIPQGWRAEMYIAKYGAGWWRLFDLTGFDDTYHSWWYRLSLVLLVANLFVCTVERLGGTLKAAFSRRYYAKTEEYSRLPAVRHLTVHMSLEEVYRALRNRLGRSRFSVAGIERDCGFLISASRGAVSRLAAPVIHCGIIVVLIGGFIGAQFGFSVVIDVGEGEIATVPERDFELLLEDFEVVFAPSGRVKDYYSTLTVLEAGDEVLTKTIEVNDPLRYAGLGIYQSSYGEYPRQISSGLISIATADSEATVVAQFLESREIPEFPGLSVEILDYAADFRIRLPEREVVSASWEPRNPAVKVRVARDGVPILEDWLFLFHPSMHGEQDVGVRARFLDYDPYFYSGLQVASNPGLMWIWVGFGLICLGLLPLLVALKHDRVWAKLAPGPAPDTVELWIAGTSHRGKTEWKSRFSKYVDNWERYLSKKSTS
jgi:cytochrome c biogenesis protein